MTEKAEKLQKLKEEMERDESLPLKKGANRLVFGIGKSDTKILMVGEGPGFHEDKLGEPFVGNAGKLLDSLLASIKLNRSKVYITNVVHHRPPENRDPEPEEIEAYGKYLDEIIKIIDPKMVITLGRFSMAKFLPGAKISQVHGKLHRVVWKGKEIVVVPMYHPAAALRNGEVMRQEKADFLGLLQIFKKLKGEREEKEKEERIRKEQLNLI